MVNLLHIKAKEFKDIGFCSKAEAERQLSREGKSGHNFKTKEDLFKFLAGLERNKQTRIRFTTETKLEKFKRGVHTNELKIKKKEKTKEKTKESEFEKDERKRLQEGKQRVSGTDFLWEKFLAKLYRVKSLDKYSGMKTLVNKGLKFNEKDTAYIVRKWVKLPSKEKNKIIQEFDNRRAIRRGK